MAIIPQITLFSWEDDIENLGDNARLKLVLDNLPDEDLVRRLEAERGRGRVGRNLRHGAARVARRGASPRHRPLQILV
jgi:hypothetical protein